MSALWTREQHEWLQAMGHTVWSLADASAPATDDIAPAQAAREALREPRPGAGSMGAGDRLMQALLRVAGDAGALATLGIDAAALRGNAAAKRALWPRLRALRRDRRA